MGKHALVTAFSIALVFAMIPLMPKEADNVSAADGDSAINLVRNGEAPQIAGGGGTKDGGADSKTPPLQSSNYTEVILPLVNNRINCNNFFLIINLIKDKIFF